ncbi:MAG: 50S ribosomal protein L20 [Candidatus Pacebacteria bacterium]|nr:50S ribosomal protein L20 [Candidatus Paceibacterota bacterium]MCF7857395.1 50S ribosomal protein L20 [Candidatus Paceibacterota bacterium]
MSRVKGGLMAQKRRRKILSQVKGYRLGRSTKKRMAIEAIHHAHLHAFAHRKDKKNDFRRLWTVRLSAGLKAAGLKYSVFMNDLKKKNILLNRKMLSIIADERPESFQRILAKVK